MSHRSGETEDATIADLAVAHELRPDQDGRAGAQRPRREVQPAAADRGAARRVAPRSAGARRARPAADVTMRDTGSTVSQLRNCARERRTRARAPVHVHEHACAGRGRPSEPTRRPARPHDPSEAAERRRATRVSSRLHADPIERDQAARPAEAAARLVVALFSSSSPALIGAHCSCCP